jgi:hypothetical protein
LKLLALVHRVAEIEDLLRTGAQQALRTALDGIETDGSDLSALIAVVERAIFSDIDAELPPPGKGLPGRESKARDRGPDPSRPDSLVVPMKEMRAPRTPGPRPRLLAAGSDLAHLLDVLFRGLRIESAERLRIRRAIRTTVMVIQIRTHLLTPANPKCSASTMPRSPSCAARRCAA